MPRQPHAHRGAAGCNDLWNLVGLGQYQRQRPRPKCRGQCLRGGRPFGHAIACHEFIGHMDDHGIFRRPLFGGKDRLHGRRIQRIGREAVHSFRRHRDHAAFPQHSCRAGQGLGLSIGRLGRFYLQQLRFHSARNVVEERDGE